MRAHLPAPTAVAVRLLLTTLSLLAAVCWLGKPAHAAVHPLDAVLAEDTPMPGDGLLAWVPGGKRAYAAAASTVDLLQSWLPTTVEFDGTPGWTFADKWASSLVIKAPMLGAGSSGLTVVVDYRLPEGQAQVPGWNPMFSLATQVNYIQTPLWNVVLKDGVPGLSVTAGKGIDSATAVKAKPDGPGPYTAVRLDDHKTHQLALRVSRPGCETGSCPPASRVLVTLFVDGVVASEGIAQLPTGFNGFGMLVSGSISVDWATFKGQANFGGTQLVAVGQFRQLLVYNRALPTGELSAIRRSAALGVVGQFPPLGAETQQPAQFHPGLPAAALPMAPQSPAIAADVFGHRASVAFAEATGVNAGLSSVSGWVRFAPPKAESTLLSVKFAGLSTPLTLTAAPVSDGKTKLRMVYGNEAVALQVTLDATPRWHWVTVGLIGEHKQAFASVDGQFIGEAPAVALITAALDNNLPHATTVSLGAGVEVQTLALRRHKGASYADAWQSLVRDPLQQGPLLWHTRGANNAVTLIRPSLWGSGELFGVLHMLKKGHAAGSVLGFPIGSWSYDDTEFDIGRDRQTVAMEFELPQQPQNGLVTSLWLLGRHFSSNHNSISVEVETASLTECLNNIYVLKNANSCSTLHITIGPRRYNVAISQALVQQLVVTTPYRRSPAELAAWGKPAGSWQPDIRLNGVQLAPNQWSEDASAIAAAITAKGGKTAAEQAAWNSSTPTMFAAGYAVRALRVYPHVVGELSGLGQTSCGSLACGDAGRSCSDAAPPLSVRCGDCDASHYRSAGRPAAVHQECRPRRPLGEACTHDAMCQSGKCDAQGTGVCAMATQAECDSACSAQGRLCKALQSGFACGACKPYFKPADGAPQAAAGSAAAELGPNVSCVWAPTKLDLQPCSADGECASGECKVQVANTTSGAAALSLSAQDKLVGTLGWNNCEKSTANCAVWDVRWQMTPKNVTQNSAGKVCSVRVASGVVASANACVAMTGRLHDAATLHKVTLPDGSQGTVASCTVGPGGVCQQAAESVQTGVLSPAACKLGLQRWQAVETLNRKCVAKKEWSICQKYHDTLGATTWKYKDQAVIYAMTKTALESFGPTDLVRAFYPFADDLQAGDPALQYSETVHRDALLKNGVSPLLLDFAKADVATKAQMVKTYGSFLPLAMCSLAPAAELAKLPGGLAANAEASVYASSHNYYKCRPTLQGNGATCPPAGYTGSETGNKFCLSGYCSRVSKTCEEINNPVYELAADGKPAHKKGKSAVKFGVVRVDDTSVNIADEHAGNASKQGATVDSAFTASMSQNYVACVLGKPMPSTPLFSAKIRVDRAAAADGACAEAESTVKILGFKLDALIPKTDAGGLAYCKGINYQVKQNLIDSGASQAVGFNMCTDNDSASCGFHPENLLSLPLSRYFPKPEICVPTDEMELPEVKKDFKEAIIPLIVSIGLELDMCLTGSFGLDYESKMPQVEVSPELAIGVVARGGVGSGETGAYEVSAGVRLLLTIVSISFPVTWGVEADAILKSVTNEAITGYIKIALVQRIAMAIEFLSGEFGLYAKVAVGPFGFEWVFNLFEWTGIKYDVTLSQNNLISKNLDFVVPRKTPPSKAAVTCNPDSNPCYE